MSERIGIGLEHVSKSYQAGHPVLQPLDLAIEPGELFFLLGPSGCGKTTLLHLIGGFLRPDDGRILFNGCDVTALPPEKRKAPMVFQNYALWPHLTVAENVAFGLKTAGISGGDCRKRVASELELVGLKGYENRRIQSLSGGQQQRVALARALAVAPGLLLLDEPLSNLDAQLRDRMRVELRKICKERELTAVYVTHDRREALSMADRIGVLHDGTLQQVGTPQELYCRPVNRFVGAFMGEANFLDGRVIAPGRVETAAGNWTLPGAAGLAPGRQCALMLRPEVLRIDDSVGTEGTIAAELTGSTYLGEFAGRECRLADGTLLAVNEFAPRERKPGDRLRLRFAPEDAAVIAE